MLRRIVSLSQGQAAGEGQAEPDDMSPSPGEDLPPAPETKNVGGLASVFKGLAGATKLTKSPPPLIHTSGPSMNAQMADQISSISSTANGLPPNHMEAFEQLRTGTISDRVAAAQQLRYAVNDYPLNPVLDVWYAAKDLIEPSNASSSRNAGWELLTACVKHPASTDLERKEFFQTITALANPEDFYLQLAALVALTKGGRELNGFDYDVFPVLTNWLGMKFDSVRAARKQAARTKGKAAASGEDKDFAGLFAFTTDVIKFNFSVADVDTAEALIEAVLDICMNTSNEDDLKACIKILDGIVTFGAIPNDKLKDCVQILSSIHCMVLPLQKDAWHTLSILCRSHNGHAVVRILLRVLSSLPNDADNKIEGVREVRGAISILHRLISKSTEKGYPSIPLSLLLEGLSTVVTATKAWKIHLDILRLANALFGDGQAKVNSILVDEDWGTLFDIAAKCAQVAIETPLPPPPPTDDAGKSSASRDKDSTDKKLYVGKEVSKLVSRLEVLLADPSGTFLQRQDCIVFFTRIHQLLPDTAMSLVLDYFKEFRCCFPSDTQWEANLELILSAVLSNANRTTKVRVGALHAVKEVYDMVELVNDQVEPDFVPGLVKRILAHVTTESDVEVLREVVSFTAGIACSAPQPLFDHIIDTLHGIFKNDRVSSPVSPAGLRGSGLTMTDEKPKNSNSETPANIVTKGYVSMFMRVMHTDVAKATRLFHLLVTIAKSETNETDAQLSAMKLLFRLRSDWQSRIFIMSDTESAHLASSLYRTEASLARRQAEEAAQPSRLSRGDVGGSGRTVRGISFGQGQPNPLRSSTGARASGPKYQHLWSASDTEALPEPTSQLASPVLYSHVTEAVPNADEASDKKTAVLPIGKWLDAVLGFFQRGGDWEVYSYVLVYLPSQLSNHAIFKEAVPQLQELRKVLCEQIRMNSFQEPPSASGLRRVDVAICLLQTLTMLLSYHEYFQKTEEDEIVNTFVRGMTWERSAKCCIHALSICCYELPLSTSKALVTILGKMAQIVTQPYVAMHILEFLACLARLPSLYVNFREEEHRIVFGICFRYLQFVRDKKQASRMSSASDSATHAATGSSSSDFQVNPNATEDLPQYVYALAYHVITFWFLAVKLPDRPNHVGWIAKSLFTDVDGTHTSEEAAQITIDFMQRVSYADVDESEADPHFTSDRFGPILKKRWLVGNSIVTIEQAVSTGWAQITKRQPSGTSSYIIRESFKPPPAYQLRTATESTRTGNQAHGSSVLPSHLLVHLMSSLPQSTDQARPIPLPEDDSVNRAIRMFDHSSTVDGHKVGVIYIGENQTNEVEILANISGSADYVEFLNNLGTLTKLKGATFNAQGLDRSYGSDGEYTFCWRDRVTEMVFHVTTQMPTNRETDPNCDLKKRHIGNDFVNIIFNDSGLPFKFDTFPSEFNYVNIVITPESRASFVATRQRTADNVKDSFYKVQVRSKPGFPEISPASETKVVSLKALPDFIRFLSLNASVFSLVWANRAGGDYMSAWRNRLKEINRLRDRYGAKTTPHTHGAAHSSSLHGPTPSPPGTALGGGTTASISTTQLESTRPSSTVRDSFSSLRRSSVATFFSSNSEPNSHNHSHRSSMLSTAPTENTEINYTSAVDSLIDQIDFSKWA